MSVSPRAYNEPILPTPALATAAKHLLDVSAARVQLVDNATGETRDMPPEVYAALKQVLAALATNQAVSVVPTNMGLTTNQAADILNVSRTFVISLIETGQLNCRLVGTHRRIALDDALALRQTMTDRARRGLDELAKLDQELGLDD